MAGFHTKTFIKHDDYMTPKHAWEDIKHLIGKQLPSTFQRIRSFGKRSMVTAQVARI